MMNRARELLADSAALMRAAEIGRWCYETHTDRLYADEIVRDFLGLGARQLHFTWSEAIAGLEPLQEQTLRAFVDTARDSEECRSIEIEIVPDDGEPRYALLRALAAGRTANGASSASFSTTASAPGSIAATKRSSVPLRTACRTFSCFSIAISASNFATTTL